MPFMSKKFYQQMLIIINDKDKLYVINQPYPTPQKSSQALASQARLLPQSPTTLTGTKAQNLPCRGKVNLGYKEKVKSQSNM